MKNSERHILSPFGFSSRLTTVAGYLGKGVNLGGTLIVSGNVRKRHCESIWIASVVGLSESLKCVIGSVP